ncbi:nuclear pore complex protein Nup43 [Schistosoma bovis]|uniref:Nuclear pore complex protein Nup43 n=1 Tax=Schistosoma bovis TaxID=6184 RepID=A0A430QQ20_SCHBO|nr:nuclear pore complex protein Nup43 [Schistosoma bovis]
MVQCSNRSSVKCISFKLSRVRFVSKPETQYQELIVTGSWLEEVNRVCLWQYSSDPSVNNHNETVKPISEKEDCTTAGVLGDTVDDPLRLSATNWMPFGEHILCGNIPSALSSLAISTDGLHAYVSNELGQLAIVQVNRIPNFQKTDHIKFNNDAILTSGADISTINALERVDNSTLASVNQLGQLKLWDLRTGLNKPQRRLLRPGETQPLLCLGQHPGQPHLLSVGGVNSSSAAAYIWDLRAEQYPLTEVACDGQYIWETAFHPRQPKHLYMATETAGLLQISSRDESDSWVGFKGSRRKLTVSSALPEDTSARNVISFDISNNLLVCGHSDAVLQTVPCSVYLY